MPVSLCSFCISYQTRKSACEAAALETQAQVEDGCRGMGVPQKAVGAAFLAAQLCVLKQMCCLIQSTLPQQQFSSRFHCHNQRFSQANHENTKADGMMGCLPSKMPEPGQSRQLGIQSG